ncbi:MAG: chorismate lyase [Pseudomonadota bacterium]|nr:chorismate lyase [Pseudomonadota bacterium]
MSFSWVSDPYDVDGVVVNRALYSWLSDPYSTTSRLKKDYGLTISVSLLGDNKAPCWLEDKLFCNSTVWVRNSLLTVLDRPWMVAAVVVPAEAKSESLIDMLSDSSKPLGATKFAANSIVRKDMVFSGLKGSSLSPSIPLLASHAYKYLIVRRSKVEYISNKIYFYEIFLPHDIYSFKIA